MIGKSANPRCFKNMKTKPVEYESNKKAQMTGEVFTKCLLKLNSKFRKKEGNIMLFIDNYTVHNFILEMENVKVEFFLANMTSIAKPMDQGIIKSFNHYYCLLLVLIWTSTTKLQSTSFKLHGYVGGHGIWSIKKQLQFQNKRL